MRSLRWRVLNRKLTYWARKNTSQTNQTRCMNKKSQATRLVRQGQTAVAARGKLQAITCVEFCCGLHSAAVSCIMTSECAFLVYAVPKIWTPLELAGAEPNLRPTVKAPRLSNGKYCHRPPSLPLWCCCCCRLSGSWYWLFPTCTQAHTSSLARASRCCCRNCCCTT